MNSQLNLRRIGLFEYHLVDPIGWFMPLDCGSLLETIKEPTWHESLVEPQSLAVFLQYNILNCHLASDKLELVKEIKNMIFANVQKIEMEIPILQMKFKDFFDNGLIPIYNDLIILSHIGSYFVSLSDQTVQNLYLNYEFFETLEHRYRLNLAAGLLLAIGGNIKRALIFEDVVGYSCLLIDAGRIIERIKYHCSAYHLGCREIVSPDIFLYLNRVLGFSGNYYSIIGLLEISGHE
jgi:hypothetical protein